MLNLAANYLFDGYELIKNSYITLDRAGTIIYVGKKDEGLIERPRMIFYNGIISPCFANAEKDVISQRNELSKLKEISIENPQLSLIEILKLYTSDYALLKSVLNSGRLEKGIAPGIILLENLDLINLKLKVDTFVKILF